MADLAEHLMSNLWFFAANGYLVYDDVNESNIPGTERFSSLRHAGDPVPLSVVEQYTLTEASAELATAANNGVLVLQAMGLGGWMYDGLDALSVLGGSGDPRAPGLGFVADHDDRWPLPNVTGLPGYFETLSPPHVPSVEAGVAKFVTRRFGPVGRFTARHPGHGPTPRKFVRQRCHPTGSPSSSHSRRPTSTTRSASCRAPCPLCMC
ncbi:hypothetical protein I553_10314 [Mycobacterium xenopi 4042]|uniref:Uncharacterized protein n=1 Tax=Mycobacterium xenopi 4042 TaxID=1299334 RepID=X7ZIG7_MYCXE|nr:hypothetical protein I553_10314 [Mycobacterium xenopi 4042]EUA24735.1 hypothetical protein I552_3517 [Mycobacterium xenopi 3993]